MAGRQHSKLLAENATVWHFRTCSSTTGLPPHSWSLVSGSVYPPDLTAHSDNLRLHRLSTSDDKPGDWQDNRALVLRIE